MNASFDIAATTYDATFTNSTIGRLQRDRVWTYLEAHLLKDKPLKILELNCGTGEDALFLSIKGHEVIATDIAFEMVSCSKEKLATADVKNVEVLQLDVKRLKDKKFPHQFDLIFSNFGGLNCLSKDDLVKLNNAVKKHLKPKGRFISVIMPSFCIMESLYFLAKLEWKSIFRRNTKDALNVNVEGEAIKTWYYSPRQYKNVFSSNFSTINIQPIGFLPSYFEQLAKKNPSLLNLDQLLGRLNFSSISDHFLIDFEVK